MGFRALGIDTFPVRDVSSGAAVLRRLVGQGYALIYVVEDVAAGMLEVIAEYASRPLPAIVLIPGHRGSLGIGMAKVRRAAEKAIGADIIFGKEGK